MPLFSQTEERIFSDIMYSLVNETNITRTSAGSKTRALAEAVSKKMGRMWAQFDLNIVQAFIDGAEGQYLDFIGSMMGVARLGEKPAIVAPADKVLKFFVDLGTFGDINGGSSITVPAGTIISTGPTATGTQYRVVTSTLLLSTTDETFIGVQSVIPGTSANLGARQLVYHDFLAYVDSANDSLKVTNDAELINGQNLEGDTNYRFRITNQILSLERANLTAIRINALSIPGVADIVLIPFNKGIGTYDILIKSTVPNIPQTLISTVQQATDSVAAHGIIGLARGPAEIGFSLVGTITPKRVLSSEEETNVINTVTENVKLYINSLDIGEELIVNEILERVMATSDLIKTLGTFSKPFDNLFIYRPTRLEDNKKRETLISDFAPAGDERVIVENVYAGATPLLFRIA